MTDQRLQKGYLVTRLRPQIAYNIDMNFPTNEQHHDATISTGTTTGPRRGSLPIWRAGLVVVTLLGAGALLAACGGGSPATGVASLGTTTTTSGSSTGGGGGTTLQDHVLAYMACMRTHGEPNMPNVTITASGLHMSAAPVPGFNPNSPQFAAATKECDHFLGKKGGSGGASTISPVDQADYLKAAVCMRSHGVPNFPDPTFENGSVEFNNATQINTDSPVYKSALATCQKLIPAGLPYSSTSGS